ncbi:uncharacterized protein RJT20DRAFT_795 [Scheffersomyces xylosifermentans]|uniref:uncharacterized protein n=1 Tax=Scheffersomyces xylosifermentans TaxID=1304137 RepID=UPI00315CF6EC
MPPSPVIPETIPVPGSGRSSSINDPLWKTTGDSVKDHDILAENDRRLANAFDETTFNLHENSEDFSSRNYTTTSPSSYKKPNITNNDNSNNNSFHSSHSSLKINTSKEEQFLKNNTKGWAHGVKVPYSVIKFDKLENAESTKILSKTYDQDYFKPRLVLDEIEHSEFTGSNDSKRSSIKSSISRAPDDEKEAGAEILRKDEIKSAFSGYYSIPRASLNIPNCYREDKEQVKLMQEIPKLCYQNYFDYDELTYTFGGFYNNRRTSFKHLGIPKNVDLDRISIHFPAELPPFVSKDILTNPFMCPNDHFFMFNPMRGTISYLDTVNSKYFPGHLCSLVSAKISQRHVFFYGGFEIQTLSVNYDPEVDRWIIRKNIALNEDGYILDVVTLRFSKVQLKQRGAKSHIGRLGCGITANIFDMDEASVSNVPERIPSPPVFTDSRKDKLSNLVSPNLRPMTSPKPMSGATPGPSKLSENYSAASVGNGTSSSPINNTVISNLKREEADFPATPQSNTSSASFSKQATNQSTASSVTQSSIESGISRLYASGSNLKASFTNNSNNTSSGSSTNSVSTPTTTSKMSKVFSKSSRLLHRHTTRNNQRESKSEHHPLKNTYSKQVKQNRSNSQTSANGTGSRPVSPVQKVTTKAEPIPLKIDTKVQNDNFATLTNSTPSPDFRTVYPSSDNIQVDIKPLPSYSSSSAGATYNKTATSKSPDCNCDQGICDLLEHQDSESIDSYEAENKPNGLFYDSILKSGLNGVSIFVFGGFYPVVDKEGFTTFKATNELLKIDLAVEDLPKGVKFHSEAMVFNVGKEKDFPMEICGDWPSPRGYAAYALIDHNHSQDINCELDLHSEHENEEFFPSRIRRAGSPISNVSSHCSSFRTSQSTSNETSKSNGKGATEFFFTGKAFVVQGGCDHEGNYFSDFFIFRFDECKWERLSTYLFDYFNYPLGPGEDDDGARYAKEYEVDDPVLVEAELRACHHTCLYYRNEERDYLFFLGGFRNDYLRYYDKVPYQSDNYEVTRHTSFPFASNNSNLLRIPVLNLQTQTWKFMRYYYDLDPQIGDSYQQKVSHNPSWCNAKISNYAGSISLNGKIITICHGGAPQVSSQQKLQAAEAELDMVTGMFNELVSQCHKKCINKTYSESDVTKQEALCLDRCVSKYFETNVQVGENMQKLGQAGAFMGRQ